MFSCSSLIEAYDRMILDKDTIWYLAKTDTGYIATPFSTLQECLAYAENNLTTPNSAIQGIFYKGDMVATRDELVTYCLTSDSMQLNMLVDKMIIALRARDFRSI